MRIICKLDTFGNLAIKNTMKKKLVFLNQASISVLIK